MEKSRRRPVPLQEQIKLINECRQSGMSDADWCREHQIASSTFYNWVSRCRKAAADQLLEPSYGRALSPQPKQDVVPIRILPEQPEEIHLPAADMHLDNSHTIEVAMKDLVIRISNAADPELLVSTIRILKETLC